jgi:hypothetical protein
MFDKKAHIAKMAPSVNKLVNHFKNKGIEFSPEDPSGLENVIFASKEKVVKISHHSFYRYSGIACVYKEKEGKENVFEILEVTDEMFLNNFMKPIVELNFAAKK